jgi:hypothetical protein
VTGCGLRPRAGVRYLDGVRALSLIVTLALVAACSDDNKGDLDLIPAPTPNIQGDGLRLAEVNEGPLHPPDGTEVSVTGVSVLLVDEFDETSDGASAGNVYVQDLPKDGVPPPNGGMTLFDVSFNPPTLRIAPGDVVDVRGTYDQFEGPSSSPFDEGQVLPEIVGGNVSLRFESSVPVPFEIPLSDLGSYETGRQWIGMLVTVKNVVIQSDGFKSTSGRYSARMDLPGVGEQDLPTITNALFDIEGSGIPFTTGTQLASVTGVVQYFYVFSIAARSVEDITP